MQSDLTSTTLDVDTAVRVCHTTGKYEDELNLVKNHKWYLTILLEDFPDERAKEALDYIHSLEWDTGSTLF